MNQLPETVETTRSVTGTARDQAVKIGSNSGFRGSVGETRLLEFSWVLDHLLRMYRRLFITWTLKGLRVVRVVVEDGTVASLGFRFIDIAVLPG